MFKVEFLSKLRHYYSDNHTEVNVLAPNVKEAIKKAKRITRGRNVCKLHDIIGIELLGECDG